MTMQKMVSFFLAALFLAGCQPALAATPQPEDFAATPQPIETLVDKLEANMTQLPDPLPPVDSGTPVTGEAPADLMAAILQDLSQRTGADPQRVAVTRAQSVVWSDGSLGCPQPGGIYIQALVPGYWVTLEFEGKTYNYHAARNGYFVLCENGQPPLAAPALPDR